MAYFETIKTVNLY